MTDARPYDEFAVLSVGLTERSDGVRGIFHVSVLIWPEAGDGECYRAAIDTDLPVSARDRILRGASQGDACDVRPAGEVAAEVLHLIGDRPVVVPGGGDAVAAVDDWLGARGGQCYDLGELFELFHPGLPNADFRGMAYALGLSAPAGAEACTDELLSAAVYLRLKDEAAALERPTLYEIARRTAESDWPLRSFFERVAAAFHEESSEEGAATAAAKPASSPRLRSGAPAGRGSSKAAGGVAAALATAISESRDGYEPRPEQLEMAAAVDDALNQPHHLVVEAGTGTGKSLAYLFPAACYALRTDARVLISTNTINLQEQLLAKDIPGVQRLLQEFGPSDIRERAGELRCAVLKGRRNYICLQRLAALRRAPILSPAETRFLTRVLIWLASGGGDRSGLTLPADEETLWNRTCAEGTNCFIGGSPFVRDGSCQLAQARRKAEASHLVVVNHALLLSDAAAERHILPGFDRLIVDEAHNLEDEATDRFGFHATQSDISNQLDAVYAIGRDREAGLVVEVRNAVAFGSGALDAGYVLGVLDHLGANVGRARERLPEAFAVMRTFVERHAAAETGYERRLHLTSGTRAQPEWALVEVAWDNLELTLSEVESGLEHLAVAVGERDENSMLEKETVLGAIIGRQLSVRATREGVSTILGRHDETQVAWLTLSQGGVAGVSSAPLNVDEVLDDALFSSKGSVVLTSATLTAGGSFDYVRSRLGIAEAQELSLGSPFDYQQAALILLPRDMPEPAQREYQAAVDEALVRLCSASGGRALVLFTSHAALRACYRAVRGRLAQGGVRVLAQGIDGAPADLVAALRMDSATAVLGTSSFWEGVDVVGDALSLLVIAKLPFSVPSDPVFAARAELVDDPFRGYALPQAVLRFKQGFGRLIRQREDRGVVAVLDRRIRSKSYGRVFLESLPGGTIREAPMAELAREVTTWLQRGNGRSVSRAHAELADESRRAP